MDSDCSVDETDTFLKSLLKKRCTKPMVENVAFLIVSTFVLACSMIQFAWAIALELFFAGLLYADSTTEPSNIFGNKHFQRTSPIFLFVCGILVLLHLVGGLLTSRKRYHHFKGKYSMQRYVFSVALGTNVIVYFIVVVFCVAGKDALLLHQSAAMTTLQVVENASEATLRRMTYYQSFFGCCGTENVTDWLVPKFLGIPDSCCNHALTSCDHAVVTSGNIKTVLVASNFSFIYNDGCKEIIPAYAYSTAVLVAVNVGILVIFFIAWITLYKQRSEKVGPVKAEVKVEKSVQHGKRKTSPMDERHSPEAPRPHHYHDGCQETVVEYSDWKSMHRGAEEAKRKWPQNV